MASAADEAYGELDFGKLNPSQSEFLWKRIGLLAFETALLNHCGRADDFELRAKHAIQACVTADALRKADAYYRTRLRKETERISAFKPSWPCKGPIIVNGRTFDDEGIVVDGAKQDLDYVIGEIDDMCRKCKTSIWAAFCH